MQIIKTRRSVFPQVFTDQPIERNDLEAILEASNWAPTHKLTQPWRFVVIQGPAKMKLGNLLIQYHEEQTLDYQNLEKKKKKILTNTSKAGAIIAICIYRDEAKRVEEWEELAATACAVQNLWLAMTALGLGGYWSTPAAKSSLKGFLGLTEHEKCLGLFYLGHHNQPDQLANRTPGRKR
ncbi:MAG: nitroreductase [Saprospiraceae bacterium]|nr:nitroreductase [Saprospiraceae bacterium]